MSFRYAKDGFVNNKSEYFSHNSTRILDACCWTVSRDDPDFPVGLLPEAACVVEDDDRVVDNFVSRVIVFCSLDSSSAVALLDEVDDELEDDCDEFFMALAFLVRCIWQ